MSAPPRWMRLCTAALLLAATASAKPLLQEGDRVVFLGDSITVSHTYMRLVELFLKLRHPDLPVTFVNAGIGANTAADGLARLETDVLALHPTVVLVNFGMNDAAYPAGSDGAAFEKNMAAILDRLERAGVRLAIWLDTSPYDVEGLSARAPGNRRARRIDELVAHAHKEGSQRKLPVVAGNKALSEAMNAYRTAGHPERLLPDRVHPGPLAHAVLAAEILAVLGFELATPPIRGRFADGLLRFGGLSPGSWSWDGVSPVTIDLAGVPPPVPLVVDAKAAADLGNRQVIAARRLELRVEGLPSDRRYRLRMGDWELGRYSSKELSRGVDLMEREAPRVGDEKGRPSLTECAATTGNPFLNDYYCLWDMLYEKDQLRLLQRYDKTRALPDFVPGKLEVFQMLMLEWTGEVEDEIRMRSADLRKLPHLLCIVPET